MQFSQDSFSLSIVLPSHPPVASVEVTQAATTVDTSAEKRAEAIKLAAENNDLFSAPLFEGKMGISLFVEDTYSGKKYIKYAAE